ncbi:MAG TPA: Sir2 family NAD-dependent protein deacetylase [Rhodocyclaceae bacterium]
MTADAALDQALARAVALVAQCDGLLVTAGAGIGVDSGLPDFRGPQGFWQAYPALGRAGLRFEEVASPDSFQGDARLGWGFYGHRLALYRRTVPHAGFQLLREIGERLPQGLAVFTSNVDGQFQKAGFDSALIAECHGSIHHLQCLSPCQADIWPADELQPEVDEASCRMTSPLPCCPRCGGVARPNILMFGDWGWLGRRSAAQQARVDAWCAQVGERLLVIELGAGTAIPSVRRYGESRGAALIRINPRDAAVARPRDVALPLGALAGLQALNSALIAAGVLGAKSGSDIDSAAPAA